jgi:peroxiredoxin
MATVLGLWLAVGAAIAAEAPKKGDAAPDIQLTDLDGKAVKLADFKGKVVYVDFWATWCPPCRHALPHTQKLSERNETKGDKPDLVVLGIAGYDDDDPDTVRSFLKAQKFTFRCLHDKDQKVAAAWGVDGIPTFAVIGRDGKIAWTGVGADDETLAAIDPAVDAALGQPAP